MSWIERSKPSVGVPWVRRPPASARSKPPGRDGGVEDGDGFASFTRRAIGRAATADLLIMSVFSQTSSRRILGQNMARDRLQRLIQS